MIWSSANRATSVFATDVDGDGDIDVLSASEVDDKIAWYENDPGAPGLPPTFTERAISTTANFASSVYATDVDGDGDTDVLSASILDGKIAWYENTTPPPRPIPTLSEWGLIVMTLLIAGGMLRYRGRRRADRYCDG